MTSKYPVSWLDCRYPFDQEARNTGFQSRIVAYLNSLPSVHILDLGAGNGSNYRFWSDHVKVPVKWTCLEIDPELGNELLQLDKNIEIIVGDVDDLDQLIKLEDIDFVMANALFDLFTEDQFRAITGVLQKYELPFYYSLNYEGMSFHPEDRSDELSVNLYHEHMKRPQLNGQAMGETGPKIMQQVIEELGIKSIQIGYSTWRVRRNHHTMLRYLLDFMDSAVHELKLSINDLTEFNQWLKLRKTQLSKGDLYLEVFHKDLLYLPE